MEDSYKHRGLRKKLIETIISKGITDEAVIAAMMKVPRHVFFDNAFLEHAYQDKAFPIVVIQSTRLCARKVDAAAAHLVFLQEQNTAYICACQRHSSWRPGFLAI